MIKIITDNHFEPLMDENGPKAENLIVIIWDGKEAPSLERGLIHFIVVFHSSKSMCMGFNSLQWVCLNDTNF